MFGNFKRVLSLVMVLAMVLSCVAILASCGGNGKTTTTTTGNGDKPAVKGEYTYNTFLSVFPTVWNNHTYQTATDGEILGYTEPGFYTFDYNETKDGYVLVPEMAAKEPIDVTADYVGEEWGIAEGDTAKAWKIVLRDNIKWEDGTPITAQDFVTSAQLLLNPVANNHRADSMYTGNMVIVNAKNYFYGGKTVVLASDSIYDVYSTDLDDKLIFSLAPPSADRNCEVSMRTSMGFPASYDAVACAAYLIGSYGKDMPAFTADAAAAMEGKTLAEIKADATLKAAWEALIGWWQTEPNEELDFFVAEGTYDEISFDTVGIKAVSDTELVIIMERPLSGFYLLYSLTGAWLVNEKLYNDCTEIKDGVYYNTYGTSAETYMSYGPYKLTDFQNDKLIVLERNDNWYGYSDPANEGLYQTTKIVYDKIDNPNTAMELFLQGKLDAKGLDVDTIAEYAGSDHVYYTDGASTFFIALNPDKEALETQQAKKEGINKTILTVKEFRMALSFALDRAAFNLACDPTGSSAFAVFNNLIISDPETGTSYRATEEAKKVLVEFWGLSDDIGEGKLYPTIDDAIKSITGYNKAMAQEYFNKAYDIAIETGLMTESDVVEILIGIPKMSAKFYSNGYEFLKNCYTEAVVGTKLEGKLKFEHSGDLGNDFSDALRNNEVDLLFGVGWQGAALDPYYLMTAYTEESYQYDPAWNTSLETIDFEIDGVVYTASVWDWTCAMQGDTVVITDAEGNTKEFSCGLNDGTPELRLQLLAALEGAVLSTYDLIPINNESSAALKGMQINYYTEEYVYGVGRGGIKYMTYNYTDAEWDAYVASQGGTLNYK